MPDGRFDPEFNGFFAHAKARRVQARIDTESLPFLFGLAALTATVCFTLVVFLS